MSGFGGGYGGGGGYDSSVGFGSGGYGDAGYSGGGGFMGSQLADGSGTGYGGRPGSGGGIDKQRVETLQPVTIKQLNEMTLNESGKPVIGNVEIGLVTMLGRIVKCDTQVTMISMVVDDCTGVAELAYMIPPDQNEYDMQKREHIRENSWVRIVGNVSDLDGAIKVEAVLVRGVPDMNELLYHRLDVIRTFLRHTRPRTPSASKGVAPGTVVQPGAQGMGMGMSQGVGFQQTGLDQAGLTRQHQAIVNYLHQRYSDENHVGVHVNEIAQNVPETQGDVETVRQLLLRVVQDGFVYNTVDDDHYQYCQP